MSLKLEGDLGPGQPFTTKPLPNFSYLTLSPDSVQIELNCRTPRGFQSTACWCGNPPPMVERPDRFSILYVFNITPHMICNILLLSRTLPLFNSIDCVLLRATLSDFDVVPLNVVLPCWLCFVYLTNLCRVQCHEAFPIFFRNFILLALQSRKLITF